MTMKLRHRGVTKSFGDKGARRIDLASSSGEVITPDRRLGSGKSTLLRCINLLEPIDDGADRARRRRHQRARDCDPTRPPPDRHGVPELQPVPAHDGARQRHAIGPRKVLGRSKGRPHDQAMAMLVRLGLADKADAYPDRCSGGQQQRVAIARVAGRWSPR
jgi:polar amino acid transport system ATP-binding protein